MFLMGPSQKHVTGVFSIGDRFLPPANFLHNEQKGKSTFLTGESYAIRNTIWRVACRIRDLSTLMGLLLLALVLVVVAAE